MSKINNWIMDMESYTWAAIEANYNLEQTIKYVQEHVKPTDENYVRQLYKEYTE
jgi:tRNA uridine 5-carbamoylmethylation protein Kti12